MIGLAQASCAEPWDSERWGACHGSLVSNYYSCAFAWGESCAASLEAGATCSPLDCAGAGLFQCDYLGEAPERSGCELTCVNGLDGSIGPGLIELFQCQRGCGCPSARDRSCVDACIESSSVRTIEDRLDACYSFCENIEG